MRTLIAALCFLATPALADVTGVASVIDGDTIEVHGQRIRLHGIDAPESRQLCRRGGKPWQYGKDAANALAGKIARQPVTCEHLGRDRYERIIGRCTVAGEDMEKWMVRHPSTEMQSGILRCRWRSRPQYKLWTICRTK